jgi:hypothetical protein
VDASARHASWSYPSGVVPIPTGSSLVGVRCRHCAQPFGITRWDSWNGFLVNCPRCGGHHGKPWHLGRLLLAGFLFNAFSFFFTMRPRLAVTAFGSFAGVAALSAWVALQLNGVDWAVEACAFIVFVGPVLVNAVVLIRHQTDYLAAPGGPIVFRGSR